MRFRHCFFKTKRALSKSSRLVKWVALTTGGLAAANTTMNVLGAKLLHFELREAALVGVLGGAVTGPIVGTLMMKVNDRYAHKNTEAEEAFMRSFLRTVLTSFPLAINFLYPLFGYLITELIQATKISLQDEFNISTRLFNSDLGIMVIALLLISGCCLCTTQAAPVDEEDEFNKRLLDSSSEEEKTMVPSSLA